MTLPPMADSFRTSRSWHRIASDTWTVPGTDLVLQYCSVNCHYVAYRGQVPLFQVLTLEAADQVLSKEGRL